MRWIPGCLSELYRQDYQNFEVIIVDNGSTDGSVEYLVEHYPDIKLITLDRNYGFARAVNIGIECSRAEYIALLNNDTAPRSNWLGKLVEALDTQPTYIVSTASKMLKMADPRLIDDAGDTLSWQGAAYKRGHGKPADRFTDEELVFSACAGAALYRRRLLQEIGGFDEYFFAYLEDVDLGLRAQLRGYRCLFVPTAEVLHFGHGSRIPGGRYVRLMTRNRLILLFKNIPMPLLWRKLGKIIYGQLYFFVVYRKPLHSFLGYTDFLAALPHILRCRRRNMQYNTLSIQDIATLLRDTMEEPPLSRLIWNRLGRLVR